MSTRALTQAERDANTCPACACYLPSTGHLMSEYLSLQKAWMASRESGILQALRNDPRFGPSGLIAFRFAE